MWCRSFYKTQLFVIGTYRLSIFWRNWSSFLFHERPNKRFASWLTGITHYLARTILVNSNWSYSPETPNLGQIFRWFLEPCDLETWRMTLQNNRAPLLCYFKLYASFRTHWWIQTSSYSPETLNSGQNRRFFLAVWPSNFTDDPKNQ